VSKRAHRWIFPFLSILILLWVGGCKSTDPVITRHEFEQPQMGVPFRIILYAPTAESARKASEAAFARISFLNQVFSDYEETSETTRISNLSGTGVSTKASREMQWLLQQAIYFSKETDGAFDVTVGPLVSIWKRARRQRELPNPSAIEEALSRVGYKKIDLDAKTGEVRLKARGMKLDFGSIAKGYAVDEALKTLRMHGVKSALVTGGGDMAAGNPPPGTKGWTVRLESAGNSAPVYVEIKNCGLATSGDLFQFVELNGVRYSHIVDPRLGWAVTNRTLVTVIAPTAIQANGISTSTCVMGPDRGFQWASRQPGAELRVLYGLDATKPSLVVSTGFSRFYKTDQQ
jgi:thiamine biosynthesis lipoprotein